MAHLDMRSQQTSGLIQTARERGSLYGHELAQDHWTERGRATAVANSDVTGRPRRSVLALDAYIMSSMSISGWIALAVFVTVGCAFEVLWLWGFERLDKRLTRSQKIAVGSVLISVAVVALSYGLFQFYHR